MVYEDFEVVEANERFGFARLKSVNGDQILHAELFPDDGEAFGPLQLRVGDRVRGLRRGQSVSRVSWVSKQPPPAEQVSRMRELTVALTRAHWEGLPTPELLADRAWRNARDVGDLDRILDERVPRFFSPEATAFEDEELLQRFEHHVQRHLSGFSVKPVAGEPLLRISPGEAMVAVPEGSAEDPLPSFRPLIDKVNALLTERGVPERWVQVHRDWRLGSPDLVALLVRGGVVQGALLN